MKSFIIQIEERNESILLEILRRFDAIIQPLKQNADETVDITPLCFPPKTLGNFLAFSETLDPWSDEEVERVEKFHQLINQYQPPEW